MIAPAARANLLAAKIDKAAILASYEQGLFTVGHLRVLLDNYESLQGIGREEECHEDHPCGLCDTSGRCTFACESAEQVPKPCAPPYVAMLVLATEVLDDLAAPDPQLRKLEQMRAGCARLSAEIKRILPE